MNRDNAQFLHSADQMRAWIELAFEMSPQIEAEIERLYSHYPSDRCSKSEFVERADRMKKSIQLLSPIATMVLFSCAYCTLADRLARESDYSEWPQ